MAFMIRAPRRKSNMYPATQTQRNTSKGMKLELPREGPAKNNQRRAEIPLAEERGEGWKQERVLWRHKLSLLTDQECYIS